MRIPHHGLGDRVPPPALVAAWFKVGDLATERAPFWAAHWISDGMDGEALAILAGMNGSDPHLIVTGDDPAEVDARADALRAAVRVEVHAEPANT